MSNNKTRPARAIRQSFQTTLRSGVKGLATVLEAVNWSFEHGDTSLLSHMLKDSEGQKAYVDALQLIVKGIWTHAAIGETIKLKRKIDGEQYTIENKDHEAIVWLAKAVADGRSLLSDAVAERFGKPKAELTDEQRLEKAVALAAKLLSKDGCPWTPVEFNERVLAKMAEAKA
jgi:hypothetical protein